MKNTEKNLSVTRTDRDTGEVITITPEMEQRLQALEFSIVSNWVQTAINIKTIRDEKLFLVRCDTFSEYVQGYLRESLGISTSNIWKHLQIATTYSDTVLQKVAKGAPMQSLIELSRNPELVRDLNDGSAEIEGDRVVYDDGTFESLAQVRERIKKETAEAYKKKLEEKDLHAKGRETILKDYQKRVQDQQGEIAKMKEAIEHVVNQKGIDADKIMFITQKKEALNLISEVQARIIEALGDLSYIPESLLVPDVTAQIASTVAMLSAGAARIREKYGAIAWLPKVEEDPANIDVVPE